MMRGSHSQRGHGHEHDQGHQPVASKSIDPQSVAKFSGPWFARRWMKAAKRSRSKHLALSVYPQADAAKGTSSVGSGVRITGAREQPDFGGVAATSSLAAAT